MFVVEPPAGSDYLNLLRLSEFFSIHIADINLSHLGKMGKISQTCDLIRVVLHLEG